MNLYLHGPMPVSFVGPSAPHPRSNVHLQPRGMEIQRIRALKSQGLSGLGELPVGTLAFGLAALAAGGYLIAKSLKLL